MDGEGVHPVVTTVTRRLGPNFYNRHELALGV
jgi:hypothetical protein